MGLAGLHVFSQRRGGRSACGNPARKPPNRRACPATKARRRRPSARSAAPWYRVLRDGSGDALTRDVAARALADEDRHAPFQGTD
ncbi:hypothetical protein GCM10027445_40060 [Amycolatopsis endophytica]|uniref:Uncharacterized protein n=1 Tax=Amycolatopsis endophytica TaxID=860233 RepID=A0A853B7J3_9PSEU|nr:hypothetical protein [Amycolatopsis endophytica]NYI90765.1 hypothetical protein [Amycolatopsis endophytica]